MESTKVKAEQAEQADRRAADKSAETCGVKLTDSEAFDIEILERKKESLLHDYIGERQYRKSNFDYAAVVHYSNGVKKMGDDLTAIVNQAAGMNKLEISKLIEKFPDIEICTVNAQLKSEWPHPIFDGVYRCVFADLTKEDSVFFRKYINEVRDYSHTKLIGILNDLLIKVNINQCQEIVDIIKNIAFATERIYTEMSFKSRVGFTN